MDRALADIGAVLLELKCLASDHGNDHKHKDEIETIIPLLNFTQTIASVVK